MDGNGWKYRFTFCSVNLDPRDVGSVYEIELYKF